jgi:ParB family transcriptional regulator, chromosome partitioning protein
MKHRRETMVRMVPIEQINVVNSRMRGQEKFRQIVANIASLGIKKPITIARRDSRDGEASYDLVCGEGRVEAFKVLGQTEVPALVIDATREELLLMSLAENIARRSRTTLDMAREIAAMKERGYKPAEIAKKVDLDVAYVNGIIRLIRHGEERLIIAVERREIPLSVAIAIAESSDQDVQRAMAEAYEKGQLRGRALLCARRLVEKRKARGKGWRSGSMKTEGVTANTLLKAYKKEAARQQMLVNRAKLCETRLRFIISAVKKLVTDEGLVNLLRAERLTTLPQYIAGNLRAQGVKVGA